MGASALVLERTDLSEDPSMAPLLASEGLPTDDLQDEGRKREEAPQAVIRSREFSELCPASASYLVKKL